VDTQGILVLMGGFGAGIGAGVLLTYFISVRALLGDIRSMRFAGWRTQEKLEPPKTIPIPFVRED